MIIFSGRGSNLDGNIMNDNTSKEINEYLSKLTGTPYGLVFGRFSEAGTIPREAGCYGFIWINLGDDLVTINTLPLKPFPPGFPDLSGESFSFVDPWRNLYNRDFTIAFAGVGVNPLVQIVQVYKTIVNT